VPFWVYIYIAEVVSDFIFATLWEVGVRCHWDILFHLKLLCHMTIHICELRLVLICSKWWINVSFLLSDINECMTGNHGCNHACMNNNGSFTCGCYPGYALSEDGKTCKGKHAADVVGSITSRCSVKEPTLFPQRHDARGPYPRERRKLSLLMLHLETFSFSVCNLF